MREPGASADVIDAEREAMAEVRLGRTASRSVLGTMNDYITQIESGPRTRLKNSFISR